MSSHARATGLVSCVCGWQNKTLALPLDTWGSLQSQYFAMDSKEQLSLACTMQFLEQFSRLLRTFCCEFIYAPRRTSLQLKLISRSISAITKCSLLPVDCELPKKTQGENLIAVRLRFYCCFKYFACCSSDGQGCWRTGRVSHKNLRECLNPSLGSLCTSPGQ